jgi:7-cyano-7-deazaguanine synthase
VEHRVVAIDLRAFGGSALTADLAVPKGRGLAEMAVGIPITYVPARNTIFLAFALAWAEVLGANDIFLAVNALDYSGYPDCRPAFIEAFERIGESRDESRGHRSATLADPRAADRYVQGRDSVGRVQS